jgi:serine/threonine-protein kinase SRPK3
MLLQLIVPDFRPANILVKLANLDHLSEDEIISLLGQPEISHVGNDSGDDLPPSSPKYLVITTDLHRLGKEYLIDQICVIDFGESFQMSSPPTDLGIPENYLPPEVLLEHEHSIGPACDLWALGCTLFEIRRQLPLFYMIYDKDGLLAEMVSFFGKLPDPCWAEWEAKADFFEENGKRITMEGQEEEVYNLQTVLADKIETFENGSPSKLPEHTFSVPEDEQKLCAKLVLKLLSYTPGDRLSAKDAANDEWFKV